MAYDAHANFAYSTISVAPSPASTGTSLTVATGDGSLFPSIPFNATVWSVNELPLHNNAEIVRVTNITGDVLTITRHQESSSARAILVGDQIAATITVKTFTDIEMNVAGTNAAITGGSITVNTSGVSVNLPAYITTAMRSDAVTLSNIKVSGGTLSALRSDITFSDSNGISFGLNTNGVITGTVATNYQSQGAYLTTAALSGDTTKYVENWKLTGNTAGTTSSAQGNDLWLAGGNGVTISGSSNTLSFSVATNYQSQGAYLTTAALSGDTSKYGENWKLTGNTAGTTSSAHGNDLWLAGGNGVTLSGSSNTISVSVATNYQSQGAYLTTAALSGDTSKYAQNWKLTSNTAGTTSSAFGTDLWLAGGQGITLSGSSNSITFSVGSYITTGMVSDAGSRFVNTSAGLNLTSISATFHSDSISLSIGAYITTADLSANSSNYFRNWKLSGNTAGTTSSQQGTDLWLAGGNGVTLSGSSNTISVSVATNYQSQGAYLTTADLSQNSSKYVQNWKLSGNTAGTTSSAQGTDLWLAGGNGVTISGSSNTLSFSVATNYQSQGAYLTTAALSGDTSKYVQNWKLTGNTAGTTSSAQGTDFWLAGGNGVTISGSSNTLSFSVATNYQSQGAYLTTAALSGDTSKYVQAWELDGANTAGTTSSAQGTKLYLSAGNSLTLSGNSNTIVFSIGPYLTTADLSQNSSNYAGVGETVGTVGGTDLALTVNTLGVSILYPKWITTAMLSNAATISNINISAGTTSTNASAFTFSNVPGMSFGIGTGASAGVITASPATVSVITLSAGTASQTFGSIVFSNSNRVSFGLNGSTVTAQHALNFSGGSTSNDISDQVIFSNSNGYSFGLNASTMTVQGPYVGYLEPNPQSNTAGFAPGAGTWYLAPFVAPHSMSGGRINFLQINTSTAGLFRDITGASYVSSSTGGKNQSGTFSLAAAMWSQGTGTNSTRLESFWSNSFSWGWSHRVLVSQSGGNSSVSVTVSQSISYISEIGSDGAYTLNQFASNGNSAGAGTSIASNALDSVGASIRNMISNSVVIPVGFNTTISAGAYWLGFAWSTTTASATSQTSFAGASALWYSQLSIVGISMLELNSLFRNWGSTATTARSQLFLGHGAQYTAAANMAPPQNIAISSDLSSMASQWVPYFNFVRQGITK